MKHTLIILLAIAITCTHGLEELTLTLHGSGTTNPSRYLWRASALFEARSKIPMHVTYRAVGSSAGRWEFVANSNDYAASELPLSASQMGDITSTGDVPLHFPLNIGAIGVFMNLPTGASIPQGTSLNVTGSVLARIFSRSITEWDHPDLLAVNPGLELTPGSSPPITVVHRVFGSSSTSLISEYLYSVAPSEWTIQTSGGDPVGATLVWPADTVGAEGSSGVSSTLASTPGSFGYVDAGHGQDAGLSEVALRNAAGVFLTSAQSDIAAAAAVAPLPAGGSADSWEGVTLVNQPGATTWPIVSFTYLLLRQNQTRGDSAFDSVYGPHNSQPDSGALLKAFATYLFSQEGQDLATTFGFTSLPTPVLNVNAAGLDSLLLDPSVEEFDFEISTDSTTGPAERTISVKRNTWELITLDEHSKSIADADETVATLSAQVAALESQVAFLNATLGSLQTTVATSQADALGSSASAAASASAASETAKSADEKAGEAIGFTVFVFILVLVNLAALFMLYRKVKKLEQRTRATDEVPMVATNESRQHSIKSRQPSVKAAGDHDSYYSDDDARFDNPTAPPPSTQAAAGSRV